jgi:hypothetical protein
LLPAQVDPILDFPHHNPICFQTLHNLSLLPLTVSDQHKAALTVPVPDLNLLHWNSLLLNKAEMQTTALL